MPFIVLNNAKICYSKIGEGKEVILFIHGLGAKGEDWQPQIDFFSQKYICITLDLRGYGHSQIKPPFTILQFAKDIIALIEDLKISKLHLVGISLGGIIAFQIAVLKPNLLKSLTIVNALPEFKLKGAKQYWLFYSRFLFIKILGMKTFAKILARKLFPEKSQDILRKKFAKDFGKNNSESYIETLKSLIGWSVRNQLKTIHCKTLFIASEHDYSAVRFKKFFAKKMNAKIVEIKNAHHAVSVEKPEEFNQILEKFLKTI